MVQIVVVESAAAKRAALGRLEVVDEPLDGDRCRLGCVRHVALELHHVVDLDRLRLLIHHVDRLGLLRLLLLLLRIQVVVVVAVVLICWLMIGEICRLICVIGIVVAIVGREYTILLSVGICVNKTKCRVLYVLERINRRGSRRRVGGRRDVIYRRRRQRYCGGSWSRLMVSGNR